MNPETSKIFHWFITNEISDFRSSLATYRHVDGMPRVHVVSKPMKIIGLEPVKCVVKIGCFRWFRTNGNWSVGPMIFNDLKPMNNTGGPYEIGQFKLKI